MELYMKEHVRLHITTTRIPTRTKSVLERVHCSAAYNFISRSSRLLLF